MRLSRQIASTSAPGLSVWARVFGGIVRERCVMLAFAECNYMPLALHPRVGGNQCVPLFACGRVVD